MRHRRQQIENGRQHRLMVRIERAKRRHRGGDDLIRLHGSA